MSVASSIAKLSHRRYRRFDKINRFYLSRSAAKKFAAEIHRRLGNEPLPVVIDRYFLSGHNPLSHNPSVMKWIVERYKPAFKYLDRHPPQSILEVGCGFGVSTWLLSDVAERVVGLDISSVAIEVAARLFSEIEYVCSETTAYLDANPDCYFDVLLSCYGAFKPEWVERYRRHFGVYIRIGHRPRKSKLSRPEYLRWKHKLVGYQIGFNCTLYGGKKNGISPSYPLYYFTWSYLHELRHYFHHRDTLYPPF